MQLQEHEEENNNGNENTAKVIAVVSYLTLIGWLIAIVIYGSQKSSLVRFHIRQSLGLIITLAILSFIPLIGWLLNIGVIVLWFMGVFYAIKGDEVSIPILGEFFQKHLDFIK